MLRGTHFSRLVNLDSSTTRYKLRDLRDFPHIAISLSRFSWVNLPNVIVNMPKRKAKENTIEGVVETPRRSGRTSSKTQPTTTEVSLPPTKKSKKGKSSKPEVKEPTETEDLELKKDKIEAVSNPHAHFQGYSYCILLRIHSALNLVSDLTTEA